MYLMFLLAILIAYLPGLFLLGVLTGKKQFLQILRQSIHLRDTFSPYFYLFYSFLEQKCSTMQIQNKFDKIEMAKFIIDGLVLIGLFYYGIDI